MFLQFLGFFGLAVLGLLIYFSFGLQKIDKETPGLPFLETLKKYFRDKRWATITSILIVLALILLMVLDPTGWYISWLTGGMLDGTLPAQSYLLALVIGYVNQSLFSVIFGKRNVISGFEKKE